MEGLLEDNNRKKKQCSVNSAIGALDIGGGRRVHV